MKPTPVNMRNCQIVLFMHVKIIQKKDRVENVWPANSETVKYPAYNQYLQR